MHLLQTSSATLDDTVEACDLGQTPGDIVILSFADSDLAGLAAAYTAEKDSVPRVRLAHLRDLRHPMSIDDVGIRRQWIVVQLGQFCRYVRSSDDLLRQRNAHCDFDYATEHIGVLG